AIVLIHDALAIVVVDRLSDNAAVAGTGVPGGGSPDGAGGPAGGEPGARMAGIPARTEARVAGHAATDIDSLITNRGCGTVVGPPLTGDNTRAFAVRGIRVRDARPRLAVGPALGSNGDAAALIFAAQVSAADSSLSDLSALSNISSVSA